MMPLLEKCYVLLRVCMCGWNYVLNISQQAGCLSVGQRGHRFFELDDANDAVNSWKLWGILLWQTAESIAEPCQEMTAHRFLWPNTDT